MLEGGANIVSYDLMKQAINTGHIENMKIIQSIQQMTENITKAKSTPKAIQEELWNKVYRYLIIFSLPLNTLTFNGLDNIRIRGHFNLLH